MLTEKTLRLCKQLIDSIPVGQLLDDDAEVTVLAAKKEINKEIERFNKPPVKPNRNG